MTEVLVDFSQKIGNMFIRDVSSNGLSFRVKRPEICKHKVSIMDRLFIFFAMLDTLMVFRMINSVPIEKQHRKWFVESISKHEKTMAIMEKITRTTNIGIINAYIIGKAFDECEKHLFRVKTGKWEVTMSEFPVIGGLYYSLMLFVRKLPGYAKVHIATTLVAMVLSFLGAITSSITFGISLRINLFLMIMLLVFYVFQPGFWFPGIRKTLLGQSRKEDV